jgi:hypothetical protein
MKIRLHKPKRNFWNLALLLFIFSVIGFFAPLLVVRQYAFYLAAASAALLLLGTWII